MKPSRYNFAVPTPDGGLLVFNTRTGALASFSREEAAPVGRVLEGRLEDADETLVGSLRDLAFLVADDLDELTLVRSRKQAGALDASRLEVVVMPTLDCNFACTYCYETRSASFMDAQVEAALTRYLETEIPRYPTTFLSWFGGEPLLELDTVLRVTSAARAAARGRTLIVHLTTNGWLLTPDTAERLVHAGVGEVQVTLDGPAETHDGLRVLRSGEGTFARVFENVLHLLRAHAEIMVGLRCNFNATNLGRLGELLVAVPPALRPRVRPSFEPIFGPCAHAAAPQLDVEAMSAALDALRLEANRLGYPRTPGIEALRCGNLAYCYAERESQVVVAPSGDVFKCSAGSFSPVDRVGRLSVEGRLDREGSRWSEWVAPGDLGETCAACTWLPLCLGGCRRARLAGANVSGSAGCTLVAANARHALKMLAVRGVDALN